MKLKIKQKELPLEEVESAVEEVVDETEGVIEQASEIERTKAKQVRVKKLDDLIDEGIYGVFCYGRKVFKAQHYPATGVELKNNHNQLKDFGVVWMGDSSAPPKGDFIVRLPSGQSIAVNNWDGQYVPAEKQRRFVFEKPSIKKRGKFLF